MDEIPVLEQSTEAVDTSCIMLRKNCIINQYNNEMCTL